MTLTQQDIADAANVSRAETSRLLKEFDADGAIKLGYRKLEVAAPEHLEALLAH